jgi:hypothetical protein
MGTKTGIRQELYLEDGAPLNDKLIIKQALASVTPL